MEIIVFFDVLLNKKTELDKAYSQLEKLRSQWEEIERKIIALDLELEELKKAQTGENPKYCNGMLGYEEDIVGQGITAYYYDNEQMVGTPFEVKEETIDFEWDSDPIDNINVDNFSVRWEGWVKIPATGEYKF